uniref:DUF7774 domain-containing protein n=1 Tax=Ditylenchus dipsaci TaxID=166011 RepID=A0A915DF30_9BILA
MDQKAAKLQRMPSSSGSKSPTGSSKGPDEAELKMLRARFRNRFQTFSKAIAKSSSNPNVKGGQLRVKAARRRSRTPEATKPAKTKLRHRFSDIFRKSSKSKPEKSSESDVSVKKTKPSKPTTSKSNTKSSDSDVSVKKIKQKPKTSKPVEPKESKSKEKIVVGAPAKDKPATTQTSDEQKYVNDNVAGRSLISDASTPPNQDVTEGTSSTVPGVSKQLGEYKAKRSLFERMDDEIVLDDKVLRDIANDIEKGIQHNSELIDSNLASKLVEIKKNQASVTDAELQEMTDQPFEVNEVANRVVEALTKQEVLGQVLNTDELKMLSEYFNGIRQQDEALLQILNAALEKILDRASEFYTDRKELKSFLENRDEAKMLLLDALLSRKSNFLSQLYSKSFYYANMLRDTVTSAYKTVSSACIVANVIAAATDGVTLATDAINRSADAARDLAQRSQEYVTTAREMGRGLVDGASAVASRSWIAISPAASDAPHEASSESSKQLSAVKNKEHWLTTLWKVLSSLAHLPYAFAADSEAGLDVANTANLPEKKKK